MRNPRFCMRYCKVCVYVAKKINLSYFPQLCLLWQVLWRKAIDSKSNCVNYVFHSNPSKQIMNIYAPILSESLVLGILG